MLKRGLFVVLAVLALVAPAFALDGAGGGELGSDRPDNPIAVDGGGGW